MKQPPPPPFLSSSASTAAWVGFTADTLLAIGLMLVLSLFAGICLALFNVSSGQNQAAPGVLAQMLIAIVATGGTAAVLYLWRRRATAAEKAASLQAIHRRRTWVTSVLAGAAVFVGSLVVSWLFSRLSASPAPSNNALMQQAREQYPVLLVVFAVGLAPLYEELLFRRVLFGRLAAAGLVLPGIVLSSLLFAVVHEIPGLSANSWPGMLQLWLIYGGMGAVFAWLYQRTGTLLAPILAHAVNNGAALIMLMLGLSSG